MEEKLALRLFGHPELRCGDTPIAIGRRHVLALLAILAETARPLPRGRVAGMLWPETDEATVRARLRRLMHRLSAAVGRDAIVTAGETIGLDPDIAVDSRDFLALAEAGLRMRDSGALHRAAELHGAPFLDGFELPHAQGFSDWVLARRAEFERLQARVLRTLAEVDAQAGDCDAAIAAASRLLALDPFREQSHRLLMRLHAQAGHADRLEAAFRHCVQILTNELGVAPSPETRSEYARLRGAVTAPDPFPPAIRFAAVEDGSVAYSIFGTGAPLVVVPGFVSHIEMAWEEQRSADFLKRLAEIYQVIIFDRRGLGLSERLGVRPSIDSAVSDIRTILDHAGIARASILGASEGGPIALRLAAEAPERVASLILYGTLARGSWAPDYPFALKPAALETWRAQLMAEWGKPASIEVFAPGAAHEPALRAWWARLLRQAATPVSIGQVLRALAETDVRTLLPRITAKTLVLHRRGDRAVRFGAGEHLAGHLPHATFVPLEGEDHFWWLGEQDALFGAIRRHAADPASR